MVSAQEKARYLHLTSISGDEVAAYFHCEYNGDHDPITYGGFFYDPRDWDTNGYVSVVEFWDDPENGNLVVSGGSINKPDTPELWESCWSFVGISDPEQQKLLSVQVYAARGANGINPDGYPSKRFDRKTWKEWRIWRSVADDLAWLGK